MDYIKKHSRLFFLILLFFLCTILYFLNMGEYPLIDTDETKFVSIARDMLNLNDWITPKLNGTNYYDSTPLLFWLINISFLVFGKISTFAARIPIFIICAFGFLFLFFTVSKILTKTYAIIISLIMMTSFGIIVFGRLTTNDILFSFISMISILLSFLLLMTNTKIKKDIIWILIYIFISLSILAGGIFGILPIIILLILHLFAGKLKDIFKPIRLFIGLIILFLIASPWFLIMFKQHGIPFIKIFLLNYDLIENISIKNCIYSIGLFLLGFMPWTFAFLWIIGSKYKDIKDSIISYFKDNSQDKLNEKWHKLSKVDKFLSLNTIVFFTSLIFAILYGSKYLYLILFLTFPASCISGHYWYEYIFRNKHDKSIFFATIIPNLLFIIFSFIGLFGHNFINTLTTYGFNFLIIPLIIIFFIIPLISIFSVILNGRMVSFISNLILMISLSFILTPGIFNFITINGGEKDLIEFARKSNIDKVKLATFTASKKYSLVYYYDGQVDYHSNKDFKWLKEFLSTNDNGYVITEIKDLWNIEAENIKYMLLDSGKRYCLLKYLPEVKEEEEEEEENNNIELIIN